MTSRSSQSLRRFSSRELPNPQRAAARFSRRPAEHADPSTLDVPQVLRYYRGHRSDVGEIEKRQHPDLAVRYRPHGDRIPRRHTQPRRRNFVSLLRTRNAGSIERRRVIKLRAQFRHPVFVDNHRRRDREQISACAITSEACIGTSCPFAPPVSIIREPAVSLKLADRRSAVLKIAPQRLPSSP